MNHSTLTDLPFSPVSVPVVVPADNFSEREVTAATTATTRVLHVINGEHYSGAERVQDLLAQHLPQFGFDVGFACVKPELFPEVCEAQDAPLHRLPMRWRFDLRSVHLLEQLIHDEDYHLVHAHTPRSALVGSMAARRAEVPLVYHVHSPTGSDSTHRLQNWVNARLERWSLRHAAQLITVSPSLRQQMLRQGFTADRITYVPNGVPQQTDVATRSKPTDVWTLGMTALFRPRKGMKVLLEALAALRSRGIGVQLRAVGPFETPEYKASIMQLVDRLGIGDLITWTGFVEDIQAELKQIDLLVLPSLFGEGLPMVVLEAMAAGVPVIASHVEGIPEAIRHREEGLLVEPGSVSQLAIAIEEMIAGEPDYLSLSAQARQRHAECFSAAAMAADVADVYRRVMNE